MDQRRICSCCKARHEHLNLPSDAPAMKRQRSEKWNYKQIVLTAGNCNSWFHFIFTAIKVSFVVVCHDPRMEQKTLDMMISHDLKRCWKMVKEDLEA